MVWFYWRLSTELTLTLLSGIELKRTPTTTSREESTARSLLKHLKNWKSQQLVLEPLTFWKEIKKWSLQLFGNWWGAITSRLLDLRPRKTFSTGPTHLCLTSKLLASETNPLLMAASWLNSQHPLSHVLSTGTSWHQERQKKIEKWMQSTESQSHVSSELLFSLFGTTSQMLTQRWFWFTSHHSTTSRCKLALDWI